MEKPPQTSKEPTLGHRADGGQEREAQHPREGHEQEERSASEQRVTLPSRSRDISSSQPDAGNQHLSQETLSGSFSHLVLSLGFTPLNRCDLRGEQRHYFPNISKRCESKS